MAWHLGKPFKMHARTQTRAQASTHAHERTNALSHPRRCTQTPHAHARAHTLQWSIESVLMQHIQFLQTLNPAYVAWRVTPVKYERFKVSNKICKGEQNAIFFHSILVFLAFDKKFAVVDSSQKKVFTPSALFSFCICACANNFWQNVYKMRISARHYLRAD